MVGKSNIYRRQFLRNAGAVGAFAFAAGCSSDSDEPRDTASSTATPTTDATPTEEQTPTETDEPTDTPEVDRPASYRWDIRPERNDALRERLGQYVEDDVGGLVEDHPAFDYSTDSDRDDRDVDFAALKLYRDSNFDVMANNPQEPMEGVVNAFTSDGYEDAKTTDFIRHDHDAPSKYSTEAWLEADTVADSLDLGHQLIVSIDDTNGHYWGSRVREQAAIIREAYKRHHDFDVLAWSTMMGDSTSDQINQQTGLLYSPDDDTVRTFDPNGYLESDTSWEMHVEIQDWGILTETDRFHPLLFHTDRRENQNTGFEEAKEEALRTIYGVATDEWTGYNNDSTGLLNDISATTGATEQLTRTLLEYNELGDDSIEFKDIWTVAATAAGKYIQNPGMNGVIDTANSSGGYGEYFDGEFAFYEVESEQIVRDVKKDQSGEYDNFGQAYDELEAV